MTKQTKTLLVSQVTAAPYAGQAEQTGKPRLCHSPELFHKIPLLSSCRPQFWPREPTDRAPGRHFRLVKDVALRSSSASGAEKKGHVLFTNSTIKLLLFKALTGFFFTSMTAEAHG